MCEQAARRAKRWKVQRGVEGKISNRLAVGRCRKLEPRRLMEIGKR
jgi:hypothetical protein